MPWMVPGEGNPEPTIVCYRDGELILSSSSSQGGVKGGGNSHRVMLPGAGDLFFFRVVQGRKESDAGVYWCLARNPQGSSRSRNGTLTVPCKSRHSIYLFPSFVCFFFQIIPWECAPPSAVCCPSGKCPSLFSRTVVIWLILFLLLASAFQR